MTPVNVIVVGGGTAGWLAANILNRRLNPPGQRMTNVTLIESKNIGRIGVGEATVPLLKRTLASLGIDEYEFMRRTHATFKHAIRYNNWQFNPAESRPDYYYHPFENFQAGRVNPSPRYYGPMEHLISASENDATNYWWHRAQAGRAQPFAYEIGIQPYLCDAFRAPKTAGMPSYLAEVPYAYHLNAQLFADYLAEVGVRVGIRHIVDDVTAAALTEQGAVGSVRTRENGDIAGDFFVDCSGFAALLIGKALDVPLVDYGQHLLCDRAIAMPTPLPGPNPRPYTSATAVDAGWIWEIDLTSRSGNGYVYSSSFISDDEAEKYLRRYIGARSEGSPALRLQMKAGRRAEMWRKNCVAIGLAGGFVEPLESTGIMFIDIGADWLAEFFPFHGESPRAAAHYNSIMASQYDGIRDFIALHYCISRRDDTPFWREVRQRHRIPDGLAEKLDLWSRLMPRALHMVQDPLQFYDHRNYECILFGMGWSPNLQGGRQGVCEPPDADRLSELVRTSARKAVAELPSHAQVLRDIENGGKDIAPLAPESTGSTPAALEAGIVLVSHAANARRIRLSAGTHTIAQAQIDPSKYKPDALVPRAPWRAPSEMEYFILTDQRRVAGPGSFVSIFRLEPELSEKLSAIGRAAIELPLYYDRPMFDGVQERAIELLVRELGVAYSEPNFIFRSEGVTLNRPGSPTATYDLSDGRLLGLHLDNWSGVSLLKRDEAYNRMCVNIGQESRQLLFINLPMRRIVEMLCRFEPKAEALNPVAISRMFMARFPNYPVISVDVGPGEGYIAPTENVIHDGMTARMTNADVILTVLGRFRPVPHRPTIQPLVPRTPQPSPLEKLLGIGQGPAKKLENGQGTGAGEQIRPRGGGESVALALAQGGSPDIQSMPHWSPPRVAATRSPPSAANPPTPPGVQSGLTPGIRLIGLARDRILVSAGTLSPAEAHLDAAKFKPVARVPRPDWRRPTSAEMEILTAPGAATSDREFVAVVRPDDSTIDPLRKLAAKALDPRYSGPDRYDRVAVDTAVSALGCMFAHKRQATQNLGFVIKAPGLATVTVDDADDDRLIGLHLDNWSRHSLEDRASAPNRFSVNLGSDPRRLLFVNLRLSAIVGRLIAVGESVEKDAGPTEVGRRFMVRFPNYPVIAIEIAPGHAYIAPTEDIIHDASTEQMIHQDICLTLLGYFDAPLAAPML